jgi:hypothetical protein
MARRGGNPDINKNPQTFTTDRAEPLVKGLQLRVSESMYAQLYAIEGWQEFVRDAIARALAERETP